MNKLIPILFLLFPLSLFAQAPQGLNYQAIAWDNNNLPKQNLLITVTFTILENQLDGDAIFTETQQIKTNEQGLFTTCIGCKDTAKFKTITWATGPKFLRVTIDGIATGTTQIMSVPYAMYADRASTTDNPAKNLREGPGITISGNTISNKGDLDPRNEIQILGLNGNQITLSNGGGTITLPKTLTAYAYAVQKQSINEERLISPAIRIPEDGKYMVLFKAFIDFTKGPLVNTAVAITFSLQGEHIGVTNVVGFYDDINFIDLKAGTVQLKISPICFCTDITIENIKIFIQKI